MKRFVLCRARRGVTLRAIAARRMSGVSAFENLMPPFKEIAGVIWGAKERVQAK